MRADWWKRVEFWRWDGERWVWWEPNLRRARWTSGRAWRGQPRDNVTNTKSCKIGISGFRR